MVIINNVYSYNTNGIYVRMYIFNTNSIVKQEDGKYQAVNVAGQH